MGCTPASQFQFPELSLLSARSFVAHSLLSFFLSFINVCPRALARAFVCAHPEGQCHKTVVGFGLRWQMNRRTVPEHRVPKSDEEEMVAMPHRGGGGVGWGGDDTMIMVDGCSDSK